MKKNILTFTLPLTILSFGLISKWSYGLVIDGTDEFLYGFPFIYKCRGFHTSSSTQYFILEMALDFLCYFMIWLTITYLLSKRWTINISKKITRLFWIGIGVYLVGFIYLTQIFDDVFLFKRDFDIEIFDQGFSLFENHPDRENYTKELNEWHKKNK